MFPRTSRSLPITCASRSLSAALNIAKRLRRRLSFATLLLYYKPPKAPIKRITSLFIVEASADDGQVELKGDSESREHELEELEEPTGH